LLLGTSPNRLVSKRVVGLPSASFTGWGSALEAGRRDGLAVQDSKQPEKLAPLGLPVNCDPGR
jgi:hypothetical protein